MLDRLAGMRNRLSYTSFILLGFCIYIVKLLIDGDINLYIHPRYNIFSLVMSIVAIVILTVDVILNMRKGGAADCSSVHKHISASSKVINCLVVMVLGVGLILPPSALSPQAIGRRTLNTPATKGFIHGDLTLYKSCPETPPMLIDVLVQDMSRYPSYCYEGKSIVLTGFVTESLNSPLPSDMFYLARVVMACCAIDAQLYALPVQFGHTDQTYPKDTWWRIEGVFKMRNVNGLNQLVISVQEAEAIRTPSTPYDYMDMSSDISIELAVPSLNTTLAN